jgi:hypothetical protein
MNVKCKSNYYKYVDYRPFFISRITTRNKTIGLAGIAIYQGRILRILLESEGEIGHSVSVDIVYYVCVRLAICI